MNNLSYFIEGVLTITFCFCSVAILFSIFYIMILKRDLDFNIKKVEGKKETSEENSSFMFDFTFFFMRYLLIDTPKVNELSKKYKTKRIIEIIETINSFYTFLKFIVPSLIICIFLIIIFVS